MPGISVVRGQARSRRRSLESALESVRFTDEYGIARFHSSRETYIGSTGYIEYPVRSFEHDEYLVVLEGYLYDEGDTAAAVHRVAAALLDGDRDTVSDWLLDHDGDYLICVYHRATGEVCLLSDPFGRLPTYYTDVDGSTVVSRELKFVREFARRCGSPLDADRLAVGQSLLFGYQLGTRTLFEGVCRVPPGAVVRIDDTVEVERLHRHDLEDPAHADRSVEENAGRLAELFVDACTARDLPNSQTVVSLSGGLDSRAVAGAYHAGGANFSTATFLHEDGQNADDVRSAEAVARALDVEWDAYEVAHSDERREALLDTMQGMNFLAMAFILDFFEQITEEYASPVYVTGDGGDKALPDLTPSKRLRSEEDLVEYVIGANSNIELEDAATLAGIDAEELVESVRARVRSYPETDLDATYVHFLLRERGINWLNHGEDRNRYYFWSVSPFYSLPFFQYAMNCPSDQKSNMHLYSEFLDALSPGLVDITYPNFGAPITSTEYRLKTFAFDLLSRYPRVREFAVRLLKNDRGMDARLARTIRAVVPRSGILPLDVEAVEDFLRPDNSCRKRDLYHLLTICAVFFASGGEQLSVTEGETEEILALR